MKLTRGQARLLAFTAGATVASACAAAAAFPAIGLLGWLAARRHEDVKNIFWSERTRGESQRYVRATVFSNADERDPRG
jgi:hypothetical protein